MSADGYVTKTGTFVVAGVDRTFSISLPKICSYTFDTTANVVVKDSAGAVVDPSDGKTYQLAEGSVYTWTATADGFVGKSNTVTAAAGGGTIIVSLDTAADAAVTFSVTLADALFVVRDGGGNTVPANSDGTYSLSSQNEYSYTASALHYNDLTGSLTPAAGMQTVALEMTKKRTALPSPRIRPQRI